MTQLENNLILLDKTTNTILGQQINGINESALLSKLGSQDYQDTKRRPCECILTSEKFQGAEFGKELPTWRMTIGSFARAYPDGEVFLNDYKMFKDVKKPIKTLYDSLMDMIFEVSVYAQATDPNPVFPTLKNIDPRLPPKELVWMFNVGDDYVAVTQDFVRDAKNETRNIKVGNQYVVASYDPAAESLGIWKNPSGNKPLKEYVNVHGHVGGNEKGMKLERLNTVKAGCFWCIMATFFPKVRVNPES